jgi:UDP-2,3-diacylglucosamine pyrophosphatase LpxH
MGKTIVMSDLHVSNCEKYAWCSVKGITDICNMLEWVANDTSVSELVLLGDLFDMWAYPVDVVPWTAKQIIGLQARLVSALQACVTRLPAVIYLPGNHDMGVTAQDLLPFAVGSKTISLQTPSQYNNNPAHKDWHLEHGHDVDMFNAPYDESDSIGNLPFGFFITRLTTQSQDPAKARQLLHDTLQGHFSFTKAGVIHLPSLGWDPLGQMLITAIVDVLADHAKIPQDTPIRFSDPTLDAQKITIAQVKSHYGKLLGKWWTKCEGHLGKLLDTALVAVRDDGLNWYAQSLQQSPTPPKVMVLGHTHHSETLKTYSNDGCWCHASNQSYVVIENGVASVLPY